MKKKTFISKFLLVALSIFLFIGTVCVGIFSVGYSAETSVPGFTQKAFPNITMTMSTTNDENRSWIADSSGSVSGTSKSTDGGVCGGDTHYDSTLTITYIGSVNTDLSFDYVLELNGGTFQIDGKNYTTSGSYSYRNANGKDIIYGDSIKIYMKSNSTENDTKITLSNFNAPQKKIVSITFLAPIHGNYTVDNVDIVNDTIINSKTDNDFFNLKAVPSENSTFVCWISNDVVLSYDLECNVKFKSDSQVYPKFRLEEEAIFFNNGKIFEDLNDAISSMAENQGDKIIRLLESGSLVENTKYIIPNGVTLFIPNSENATIYTNGGMFQRFGDDITKDLQPFEYRHLIIPKGASIEATNGGCINVGGIGFVAGGSSANYSNSNLSGSVIKGYGHIILENGSNITLKNGSTLYCYGYITGSGKVNAENGSDVHEFFQLGGFRGGSDTLGLVRNEDRAFVFNQYFVQNIEAEFIINSGAELWVHTALYASTMTTEASFCFIDDSNSDSSSGVFLIKTGFISRKYDYINDRIIYDVSGEAVLSSISLKVSIASVNSADYVLPITNNFTINVHNGSSITINQDLCLLPGVILNLENGSNLFFSPNKYLVVYDSEHWNGKNYAFKRDYYLINYSASLNGKPTVRENKTLEDAELNINGTINFQENGCIYTTADFDSNGELIKGGAFVHSSNGTGKIVFETGPGNLTQTHQVISDTSNRDPINVCPMLLKNGENSADTYFNLNNYKDEIVGKTVIFDSDTDTWTITENGAIEWTISFTDPSDESKTQERKYIVGQDFIFPGAEELGFSSDYILKGWLVDNIDVYKPNETYKMANRGNLNAIAIWGGWINLNGVNYYVDYNGSELTYLKGLNKVESAEDKNKIEVCLFNENGSLNNEYRGLYLDKNTNSYYLLENGVAVTNPGFYRFTPELSETMNDDFEYVYIKEDGTVLTKGTYYLISENQILPNGTYTITDDGFVKREDASVKTSNGQVYIKEDTTYIDGIKVSYGLFTYDNHYYYSDSNCKIVKNSTHYVRITNGLNILEGLYYFDENGYLCSPQTLQPMEVNA